MTATTNEKMIGKDFSIWANHKKYKRYEGTEEIEERKYTLFNILCVKQESDD